MQTGENEQGLRKIIDLTRMISIAFYSFIFIITVMVHLKMELDRILRTDYYKIFIKTGLFSNFNKSKLIALVFLIFH